MEKLETKMIEQLVNHIPEKKAELEDILAYGERMKAEGERKKKEFWSKNYFGSCRERFKNLLRYKWKHEEDLQNKYEYLNGMEGIEKGIFIKEYLGDDMLYSEKINPEINGQIFYNKKDLDNGSIVFERGITLGFFGDDSHKLDKLGDRGAKTIAEKLKLKLKEGIDLDLSNNDIGSVGASAISKIELKEGVTLDLGSNNIGAEGADAISKMKLKKGVTLKLDICHIGNEGVESISKNMVFEDGVTLNLSSNQIGDKGADAISKMDFKEGVTLDLEQNEIGDEGVEAIAENLKLEEGVNLDLSYNKIGDEGARAIAENLKLKNGVIIHLESNEIGDEGAKAIMENMKLKEGVTLHLGCYKIGDEMKQKLKEWEKSYLDKGIHCAVLV